jgi:hypothetical protein
MYRIEINIYEKELCVKLITYKDSKTKKLNITPMTRHARKEEEMT